jgi:hypothetical protein
MIPADLAAMGHDVLAVPTIAGGMNAIQFHGESGAACWRARESGLGWRKELVALTLVPRTLRSAPAVRS